MKIESTKSHFLHLVKREQTITYCNRIWVFKYHGYDEYDDRHVITIWSGDFEMYLDYIPSKDLIKIFPPSRYEYITEYNSILKYEAELNSNNIFITKSGEIELKSL